MLIVIDISCKQLTRPGPLCSGPEKHKIFATMKSIKQSHKPSWRQYCAITYYYFFHAAVLTWYLGRDAVILKDLTVRFSLYLKGYHIHLRPIYHSCLLLHGSLFIYHSIRLSIHQLMWPLFHIRFCQGPCKAPLSCVYRHLIWTVYIFQIDWDLRCLCKVLQNVKKKTFVENY